jgi:hypothetical protein
MLRKRYNKAFQADSVYAPGILEIFKVGSPLIVSCSRESTQISFLQIVFSVNGKLNIPTLSGHNHWQ